MRSVSLTGTPHLAPESDAITFDKVTIVFRNLHVEKCASETCNFPTGRESYQRTRLSDAHRRWDCAAVCECRTAWLRNPKMLVSSRGNESSSPRSWLEIMKGITN